MDNITCLFSVVTLLYYLIFENVFDKNSYFDSPMAQIKPIFNLMPINYMKQAMSLSMTDYFIFDIDFLVAKTLCW